MSACPYVTTAEVERKGNVQKPKRKDGGDLGELSDQGKPTVPDSTHTRQYDDTRRPEDLSPASRVIPTETSQITTYTPQAIIYIYKSAALLRACSSERGSRHTAQTALKPNASAQLSPTWLVVARLTASCSFLRILPGPSSPIWLLLSANPNAPFPVELRIRLEPSADISS